MRARPGEYLGSFVFLDFYFLLEAFTIDPPPDQKRMKKKKEEIVAEKKCSQGPQQIPDLSMKKKLGQETTALKIDHTTESRELSSKNL